MVALLVVAVALGLNNFGASIAIGVSGVNRRTEFKVAAVFGLCDVVMPAAGMLIGRGVAGELGPPPAGPAPGYWPWPRSGPRPVRSRLAERLDWR